MENNKILFDDAEVTEGVTGDAAEEEKEEENEEETPDEATPVQE